MNLGGGVNGQERKQKKSSFVRNLLENDSNFSSEHWLK